MSIRFDEKYQTFTLNTCHTSYQMKIGNLKYLYHLYYGPRLGGDRDLSYQIMQYDRGFSGNPYESRDERTFSLDVQPQEFSTQQQGDFRIASIDVMNGDGSRCFNGKVRDFTITPGKYRLSDLPTCFATESDTVESLEVILEDEVTHVQIVLRYAVFEEADIITRSASVRNAGKDTIHVKKFMSTCLDFLNGSDKDLLHLPGRYGQERQVERQKILHQVSKIASGRGTSSHQQNPFVAVCDRETSEDYGGCYGMALMYSGNFLAEIELDQYDQLRVQMGINPKQFDFALAPGEKLEGPEALLTYTRKGFTGLSHIYHDFFCGPIIFQPIYLR